MLPLQKNKKVNQTMWYLETRETERSLALAQSIVCPGRGPESVPEGRGAGVRRGSRGPGEGPCWAFRGSWEAGRQGRPGHRHLEAGTGSHRGEARKEDRREGAWGACRWRPEDRGRGAWEACHGQAHREGLQLVSKWNEGEIKEDLKTYQRRQEETGRAERQACLGTEAGLQELHQQAQLAQDGHCLRRRYGWRAGKGTTCLRGTRGSREEGKRPWRRAGSAEALGCCGPGLRRRTSW